MKIAFRPVLIMLASFAFTSTVSADTNVLELPPGKLVSFPPNKVSQKKLALSGKYKVVFINKDHRHFSLRPKGGHPKKLLIAWETHVTRTEIKKGDMIVFNSNEPIRVKEITYTYGCAMPADGKPRQVIAWVESTSH